jgi:hypothetical protein
MATIERTQAIPQGYEDFGCRVNAIGPAELFCRYQQSGLLDADTLRTLRPLLPRILESWSRARDAGERIQAIVTHDDPNTGSWASVTKWRSGHAVWTTQHFASIGGPAGSRAVLLATAAASVHGEPARAQEIWFRTGNGLAGKVFGSMVDAVGSAHAAVTPVEYVSVPLRPLSQPAGTCAVRACGADDHPALVALARRARGRLYPVTQELDHDDLLLDEVDELYAAVGLRRYRRIWLAWEGDEPVGAAIAYRGPLGMNLSFLENRCDLLISPGLAAARLDAVASHLLGAAASAYHDYPSASIPVIVDARAKQAVVRAGGLPVREYVHGTWVREGAVAWYRHVDRFYDVLDRVDRRRGLGVRDAFDPPGRRR